MPVKPQNAISASGKKMVTTREANNKLQTRARCPVKPQNAISASGKKMVTTREANINVGHGQDARATIT
jgi:hypothetical protein